MLLSCYCRVSAARTLGPSQASADGRPVRPSPPATRAESVMPTHHEMHHAPPHEARHDHAHPTAGSEHATSHGAAMHGPPADVLARYARAYSDARVGEWRAAGVSHLGGHGESAAAEPHADRVATGRPARRVDVSLPHPRAPRIRHDGALRRRARTRVGESGPVIYHMVPALKTSRVVAGRSASLAG